MTGIPAVTWEQYKAVVEAYLPQIECDNRDALFGDFEIDSLDFVELVTELEQKLNVDLDDVDLFSYDDQTLGWLYDLVAANLTLQTVGEPA